MSIVGVVLAIVGVPAPPEITTTGVPRVPWTPIAQAGVWIKDRITKVTMVDWDPFGAGIIVRIEGITGATLHRVASPGAKPEQFMQLSRNTNRILFNPDPRKNYLVYSEDTGGNEYDQLYLYHLGSKETRRITSGDSRHIAGTFDGNGERLAFFARARNSDTTRFWVVNPLEPSSMKMIAETKGDWGLASWSPDGKQIFAWKYFPPNLSFLYSLDVTTGEFRRLGSGTEGQVTHRGNLWSRDGRYVYYAGDWNSEFLTLRRIDLTTGKEEALCDDISWDVAGMDISTDDTLLAVLFNEEGARKLYTLDTRTKELRKVPGVRGSIVNFGFHPTDRKLIWTQVRFDNVQSIAAYDYDSGQNAAWLDAPVGAAQGDYEPRLIHYPTFDEVDGQPRMIPAWFWPAHSADGRPTPVLITIHGGPAEQSGPVNPAGGLLARRGISELQPNIRGSSGYGKTYLSLDDGRRRADAIKDVGALLDWVKTQPDLDSTRVAVLGASYGGFMALASAVHYSDRLACAIDFYGISNFGNMIRETREGMRDWARVEFGDERDPEMKSFLDSISPLESPGRIKSPLFVFQGANDTRVPVGESRRMVAALRARGQPVWYIEASGQGHAIPNPINSFYVVPAVLSFLDTYLLGSRRKQ
jgi:dipeptidyl aminopeptidase/acylaminoacyl peptidase